MSEMRFPGADRQGTNGFRCVCEKGHSSADNADYAMRPPSTHLGLTMQRNVIIKSRSDRI